MISQRYEIVLFGHDSRLSRLLMFVFLRAVFAFGYNVLTGKNMSDENKKELIETMYKAFAPRFKSVPEITADEILQKENQSFVLVDVREDAETSISRIKGSITKKEYEKKDFKLDPSSSLVFYCTIGYRSGEYAKKVITEGKFPSTKIYNLKGSVLSWAHAGGKLVDKDENITKTVHVYGKTWDLLPKGYDSVKN
eukprot:maker-scaffold_5-snap-gene-13.10-mRNA-1 protein AED:0.08 eAED:0.08 QI:0/0.75/0.4/1/1/1/5/0/194